MLYHDILELLLHSHVPFLNAAEDPRVLGNERVKRVVDRKLTILLLGETGSGKEAFAKAIHGHSQRCDKRFGAQLCGHSREPDRERTLRIQGRRFHRRQGKGC